MIHKPSSDISFRDAIRLLRRHRKKVCLFAVVTLCAAATYSIATPRTYLSEAKLFIRIGRETIGLDPIATTKDTLQVSTSREYEINSAIEMLESRTILGKVVDALGPDKILAAPEQQSWLAKLLGQLKKTFERQLALEQGDEKDRKASRRYAAIEYLQRHTTFSAPKETQVITIACKARSPMLAQKLVAALVDAYNEEHVRLSRTPGSLKFFAGQTELLHQKLTHTTQQLLNIKNDKKIVSIEGQFRLLEAQKDTIEEERLRTDRELATAKAQHRWLKKSFDAMDERMLAQRDEDVSQAAVGMRQQLYDLEIRERELRAIYSEHYPLLRTVQRQVATARKIYEEETGARTQSTSALELLQLESQIAAIEGTQKSLVDQHGALVREIRDLNVYALQVKELERQAAMLEKNYLVYSENLEQTRIDTAIAKQRISNVSIIQTASLPRKAISPNNTVTAALGLFVVLFGSVALALLAEYFDPRLKSPVEIENELEIPVLISIPHSNRQRVNV